MRHFLRRNRTEEDPLRPCAVSLKVGPFPVGSALAPGEHLNVVRIHPRDVVAVPVGTGPLRCCGMQVIAHCDPAEALPRVAVSASWAAKGLEAEDEFAPAAPADASVPVAAATAHEEQAAPADGTHAAPKKEPRLGFFTRAMVKLHDVVEGAGKAATDEQPETKARMPAGPARPATP